MQGSGAIETHFVEEPGSVATPVGDARRRRGLGLGVLGTAAACVIALWVVLALIGQWITPWDPLTNNLDAALRPPVFFGGTWNHPLGTDPLGRDMLSRVISGSRPSAIVAFVSVGLSALIGVSLGCGAGYSRKGWLDAIIMRLSDVTLAFPAILLALLLAVQIGPQLSNVVIVLGLLLWAQFAKLTRSEVLSLRDRDFVRLAVIAGASRRWIMVRHVLPNILPSILVLATFQLAVAILAEASLSFLGAGIPPPQPAWGSMVASGQGLLETAWWVSLVPAAAIAITVLAVAICGDAIRDRLDPRAVEKSML